MHALIKFTFSGQHLLEMPLFEAVSLGFHLAADNEVSARAVRKYKWRLAFWALSDSRWAHR